MALTVVVNAFNRPAPLRRLLDSLVRADVPEGTRLYISIDGGGHPDVPRIAEGFAWPNGEKVIRTHDRNLGLVEHFIRCGDLTRELGDIVFLEDDLAVSRKFAAFALQALAAYRDDERIAGISLNRLAINGYTHHRFEPLPDAGDVFFAQVFWYQGQAFTPAMWARFKDFWLHDRSPIAPEDGLHPLFLPHPRWANDFFPDGMRYLHTTGRFFAFPRESHTTQFGDPGVHFHRRTDVYQVPLQHHREFFHLPGLDDSRAVYDSFLEILPNRLAAALPGFDFDVDLNATKPRSALRKPHTLTTRPARQAVKAFGLQMHPAELNVIDAVPGAGIRLARTGDLHFGRLADLRAEARLDRYHRPNRPGLLRDLLFRLARRFGREAG